MSKQFHFGNPGSLPVILSSAKMPNPELFEGQCPRCVIMSVREWLPLLYAWVSMVGDHLWCKLCSVILERKTAPCINKYIAHRSLINWRFCSFRIETLQEKLKTAVVSEHANGHAVCSSLNPSLIWWTHNLLHWNPILTTVFWPVILQKW